MHARRKGHDAQVAVDAEFFEGPERPEGSGSEAVEEGDHGGSRWLAELMGRLVFFVGADRVAGGIHVACTDASTC